MGLIIFISYATMDKDIFHIAELSSKLEKSNEIDEMLYWEEDAYGSITSYMEENVRKCDIFLLFCSPNAKSSKWVKLEWEAAINESKSLIPIFLNIKHVPSLLKSFRGLKFDQFNVEDTIQQLHDLIVNTANKGSLKSDLPTSSGSAGSNSTISITQKKFNYYKTLGNDALKESNYEEASEMFKSALETAEKAFETKLTKEAKSLIRRVKSEEEEEKRAKRQKIDQELIPAANLALQNKSWQKATTIWQEIKKLASKHNWSEIIQNADENMNNYRKQEKEYQKIETDLMPKANEAMQNGNWKHAKDIWQEVEEIASSYNWTGIIQNAEEKLKDCKQQIKREIRKIETDLIPKANEAMQNGNWKHAKDIWQEVEEIASTYKLLEIKQRAVDQYDKCAQKLVVIKEKEVIENLEKSIGKSIPRVEEIKWNTLGVKFDGDAVLGLGLRYCGLKALPDSFSQLKNLQRLVLSNNQLTILPKPILELKNLQILNLVNNNLTTLPDSFGQLKSLRELGLRNNKLTTLPDSFSQLKNLQELNLWDNQLTTLPDSFGQLKNLQKLSLVSNELTTLPEPILELKNLQILYLNGNNLTTLPDSFGELKSLQELDLGWCNLTTLPGSFGHLKSLQKLDLARRNKLTTLPDSFSQVQNLKVLYLGGNQLTTLPEPILELKNLQALGLAGNQLTTLPESLLELSNLKTINVPYNPLDKKAKKILKKLKDRGVRVYK